MNLKLGRTRTPALLDKSSPGPRNPKRPHAPNNNNNVSTSPNHNAYLPLLPKYTEAAAALLHSSIAATSGPHPFYLPTGFMGASNHAISPYSIPSLGHLLEQLASPVRPPQIEDTEGAAGESPKSGSSNSGDLVMDDEVNEEMKPVKTEVNGDGGDLEAVKRILETVNATVTKQLLQANMQKLSSETSSETEQLSEVQEAKSEGLAAKLEDALTTKTEDNSISEDDNDYERSQEADGETITTTDHVSEDGRKVRVRSLISEEQAQVLKEHYAANPRPKREELVKIADSIGFPVRVVQVWFQNTRARDRREGRMIQVPYTPAASLPIRFHQPLSHKLLPLPSPDSYISEQPLDLSTKKGNISSDSSPSNSPQRPTSVNHHSDSGEEVVNLSRKSSRSPTPYNPHPGHYSSCSSEPYRSPSPADFNGSSSRLAQILAQPHKLAIPNVGLVPMDQLMQFGASDLPSLSQLIGNRISNLSPAASEKMWSECSEGGGEGTTEEEHVRRGKLQAFAMKSLGSPGLGCQDGEPEGQFTCDQCDKAFSKQSSLARHKYEHSGNF